MYSFLGDMVVLLHLTFILFVLLGGLLALRNKRYVWIHIPAVLWGVGIAFTGSICPLTPLENWLRNQGGEAVYAGGFIEHYIGMLIYPDALTRRFQLMLGTLALIINIVIYAWIFALRLRLSGRIGTPKKH